MREKKNNNKTEKKDTENERDSLGEKTKTKQKT